MRLRQVFITAFAAALLVAPLAQAQVVPVATGNETVVGNVASGVADSGNGVKVSGVYNSSPPSFSNGQRADLQLNSNGQVEVLVSNGAGQAYVGAPGNAASARSGLFVVPQDTIYNGSTWDQLYEANAVNGTTGTGLLGAGNMVWSGTGWYRQAGDADGNVMVGRGTSSSLNITASTLVVTGVHRVATVCVITAGSSPGSLNDASSTGAAATSNEIMPIPNATGCTPLDWPVASGIVVVPGSGQGVSISYN